MRKWKHEDLTGKRYGNLVVVEFVEMAKFSKSIWKCQCDCGNVKNIKAEYLKNGSTKSCGCYHKSNIYHIKHNESNTKLYRTWQSIRYRCENKNNTAYYAYGELGVCVCEEWHEYIKFKEWAINNGYKDNLTIDRINPYGNYEPSNCRWITKSEQVFNRKNTLYIRVNGEEIIFAKYVKLTGARYNRLFEKLSKEGLLYKKTKEDYEDTVGAI